MIGLKDVPMESKDLQINDNLDILKPQINKSDCSSCEDLRLSNNKLNIIK